MQTRRKDPLLETDSSGYCPHGAIGKIRILATSDLHMNLTSFDYYSDRPDPTVGLTRVAELIQTARAEAAGSLVLLFDNGDGIQGTPVGDSAIKANDTRHPLMAAFDALNYDAIGLGNHDFNFGLETLNTVLSDVHCPVVCSNVHALGSTHLNWNSSRILERELVTETGIWPVKIGVLSVLPPQTLEWDINHLRDQVWIEDIVDTAARTARHLRLDGCDLIVALAHTGLSGAFPARNAENAAISLAEKADVDVLIAGHTHLHFPGVVHEGLPGVDAHAGLIHDKPAVMPGSAASHLGQIDIDVMSDGKGGWSVDHTQSKLRAVSRSGKNGEPTPLLPEHRQLSRLFHPYHVRTRHEMSEPVGKIQAPMHSFFSFFAPDRGLAFVAAAQAAALRAYQSSTAARDLPLLSAAAPSKFGGRAGPRRFTDVPAGAVSMRHVADLHIFPNELSAVVAEGRQLRNWLEMSACVFNQIAPETTGSLLRNSEHPGHNFDVIHGLTYEIDITSPPRFASDGRLIDASHQRIRQLEYQGIPVGNDQKFAVALTNYRANGGGNFAALNDVEPIAVPSHRIQQLVRDYIVGSLPPEALNTEGSVWRFSPIGGTQVVDLTGPAARNHLHELPPERVRDLGLNADGFLKLSISI